MTDEKRFTPDGYINKQRNSQKMILVVLIIVLAGGITVDTLFRGDDTTQEARQVALINKDEDFKQEEVTTLEITPAGEKSFVLNMISDQWQVANRFNAPANSTAVNSLLTKLFDAQILSIPVTKEAKNFVVYSLDDKSATTLALKDSKGKTLLTLLVGKAPEGKRDFVRFTSKDKASLDAIYELVFEESASDSLFSRLNMKSTTEVNVSRWLRLSDFKVMPIGAAAQSLKLESQEDNISFRLKSGSSDSGDAGDIEDEWEMQTPTISKAMAREVESVLSGLSNLSATDIAGTMAKHGPEFGFGAVNRSVSFSYNEGEGAELMERQITLEIGISKDGQTAVNLYDNSKGTFIYWVSEGAINRLFRPALDFLEAETIGALVRGEVLKRLSIKTADYQAETEHVTGTNNDWKVTSPDEGLGNASTVSRLGGFLGRLSGYPVAEFDPPLTDERWISYAYEVEGDDSGLKTAVITFDKAEGELTRVRLDKDGKSTYFKVDEGDIGIYLPEYNDFRVIKLQRIVIGYVDAKSPAMKDKERDEITALKLTNEVMTKMKAEDADIEALQKEFNEDSLSVKTYRRKTTDVDPRAGWTVDLINEGMKLAVGGVGMQETEIGFIIFKRTE
ncbi:MAG: DUF4340 domain-containing protein [Planctomycetes bacterium]|nr:DUF4340 domain-containing protein [Planctomycetota bacterium]